jgi:hypothetical protein
MPSPAKKPANLLSVYMDLPTQIPHISVTTQYMAFHGWLLSVMFLSFIHATALTDSLFIFADLGARINTYDL